MYRRLPCLLILLAFLALTRVEGFGQGAVTRYVYDDNGRLRAVVAPDGQANIYDYDPAGNTTGVRLVPPTHLEIFSFNPKQGVPGDQVTFLGVGFGGGITSVLFNGVSAQFSGITLTSFVATVPVGATSGTVTVTTPTGSVTTSDQFLIKGVAISPASAELSSGESQQFSATVYTLDPDLSVTWSVNGIVGGNASLGTVTTSGLYTAPFLPSTVTVRATSNADPTLFAEAMVSLRSVNGLRFPVSQGVLVDRPANVVPIAPTQVSISRGVLVSRPTLTAVETSMMSPLSPAVLVSRPLSGTQEISQGAPLSEGVLVERLASGGTTPSTVAPFSPGVLVLRPEAALDPRITSPISAGVLIQRDPFVPPPPTNAIAPFSRGVLVDRLGPGFNLPNTASPTSKAVLVEKLAPVSTVTNSMAVNSGGVLVEKQSPVSVEPSLSAPVSAGVLTLRQAPPTVDNRTVGPVSSGVLVRREVPGTIQASTLFIASNGVLVTNGPIITSVAPAQLTRDTTVTITITGTNLSGANSLLFIIPNGSVDTLIVASNISINAQGTSLTATVTIGPSSVVGNRLVVLSTVRGQALVLDPNANIVSVQ